MVRSCLLPFSLDLNYVHSTEGFGLRTLTEALGKWQKVVDSHAVLTAAVDSCTGGLHWCATSLRHYNKMPKLGLLIERKGIPWIVTWWSQSMIKWAQSLSCISQWGEWQSNSAQSLGAGSEEKEEEEG